MGLFSVTVLMPSREYITDHVVIAQSLEDAQSMVEKKYVATVVLETILLTDDLTTPTVLSHPNN